MRKDLRVFRLLGLGWYVALCLVIGVAGGVWLDRQLQLSPLFLLLGLALGLILAFVGLMRMVQESVDESEENGSGSNGSG